MTCLVFIVIEKREEKNGQRLLSSDAGLPQNIAIRDKIDEFVLTCFLHVNALKMQSKKPKYTLVKIKRKREVSQ
jgi:hypothetical protein